MIEVPTNPKEYMREYQRKRRAKLKHRRIETPKIEPKTVTETPAPATYIPEGCTPITVPEYDRCPHCGSIHIERNGDLIHCRACGITVNLKEGFVQYLV